MTEENLTLYFNWLDRLRGSALINMFGAAEPLAQYFGIDDDTADNVLQLWMDTFDGESSATDRAAKAIRG